MPAASPDMHAQLNACLMHVKQQFSVSLCKSINYLVFEIAMYTHMIQN